MAVDSLTARTRILEDAFVSFFTPFIPTFPLRAVLRLVPAFKR